MAVSYTALEPELEATIGGGASFTTASIPTFFTSASFVYTFAFVVIVVAASFRYAYAGALRMSATQKGIQESKGEFKRVTYGLLGVFALWLILYTVNKDMLTGNVDLGELLAKKGTGGNLSALVPSTQTGSGTVAGSGSHTYAERLTDHARVVARLSPIKTNHNNAPCTESQFSQQGIPSCTSLAYLPEQTIQLLLNINSACNCNLVISGGTEPGHSGTGGHGEGKRAVDLQIISSTDPLYLYIKSIANQLSNTAPCNIKYTWNSYTFWDENVGCSAGNTGRHWHVS